MSKRKLSLNISALSLVKKRALHKLEKLGLDPRVVEHGWGYAPIVPLHPRFDEAIGRTNDAILYAGMAHYIVNYENDKKLEEFVELAPSSATRVFQEARQLAKQSPRFLDIFKEAFQITFLLKFRYARLSQHARATFLVFLL